MSLLLFKRLSLFMFCFTLAAWSGLAYLSPPHPQPKDAPPNIFSANRAMTHVAALTTAPRPVGSTAHANARAYIQAELIKLGLAPQLQQTVSAFRFPGSDGFGAAKVQNVIARIEGTDSQGAILLNAHYDSGNTGPGAGDCGACVAGILETARALRAGPPPRHDVILVFSDAEEMGDQGAHAFATQHPWMKDVALAINYEAMGTTGPGTLYVTSQNNAALVRALSAAMPNGFGNSVITQLFNAIPDMRNACDLQDYLDYGVAGMGFVLHGGTQNYHTQLDNLDHLSAHSLQSFGDSALGLVRAFDTLGPKGIQARGNAVYFPLAPFGTVIFPQNWATPLAALGLALALILITLALTRQSMQVRQVFGGAIGFLCTPLFVAGIAGAAWAMLRAINPDLQVFLIGGYGAPWHVAGLSALAIGLTTVCFAAFLTWFGARGLVAGAVLVLAIIGFILAIILPGMFYIATIPVLLALPGLLTTGKEEFGASWRWYLLVPAMAIIALIPLLIVPSGMVVAFVTRLEAMSGLPLLPLPTAIVALASGFVIALFCRFWPNISALALRRSGGGALIVSLAALGVGSAQSGFDIEHPRPEAVRYELDANTKVAKWATNDPILGRWSGQFIPPTSQRQQNGKTGPGGASTFVAQAPFYDLAAPSVRLIDSALAEDTTRLQVMIASPRGAPIIEVQVEADKAILGAVLGGQVLDLKDYPPATKGKLIFFASALAADGFVLELTLAKDAKVQISLADMSDGLPGPTKTRPSDTMPTPGATLDGTVVRIQSQF